MELVIDASDGRLVIEKKVFLKVLFCSITGLAIGLISLGLNGGPGSLLGFYAFYVVTYLAAKTWTKITDCQKNFVEVACIGYFILGFIGYGSALLYEVQYSVPFSPYFDDTFYYDNAMDHAFGKMDRLRAERVTPFEVAVSSLMRLISSLGVDRMSVLYVLPLNWSLGSLVIAFSGQMAYLLTDKMRVETAVLLLLMICDFVFPWSAVHLYRDVFTIAMFLLGVIAFLQRRYLIWAAAAYLCFKTRGANGLLLLVFNGFSFFMSERLQSLRPIARGLLIKALVPALMIVGGLYIYEFHATDLIEMISPWYKGSYLLSFDDLLLKRQEFFWERDLPLVVRLVVYLFAGGMPVNIVREISVDAGNLSIPGMSIVDPQYLLMALFQPVLVGYLAPILIAGIWLAIKSPRGSDFMVAAFFVLTWITLALISMQQRHRIILIVFYPFFYLLCRSRLVNKYERFAKDVSRALLLLAWGVLFVNLYLKLYVF